MPTNCDASGCLRGSLAKVSFFAVSRRPGRHLCPSPSLGRVSYRPPNFSTTILEHRRVLPEMNKKMDYTRRRKLVCIGELMVLILYDGFN